MQVLVFKTNIRSKKQVSRITPQLSMHPGIVDWNVDLADCDKVLRIETEVLQEQEVEKMVWDLGHSCEALT